MLSVLPTSWQQQHGPGRRRRCGNGAARVAEPVFAPARPPPSGGPSRAALRSAAVPGAGARDRSRRPRARPPAAGRLRSSCGPAGAVRGAAGRGAAWAGRRGRGPGSDGETRRGAQIILLTRCLENFSYNIGHWFSLPSKDQNYSRNLKV